MRKLFGTQSVIMGFIWICAGVLGFFNPTELEASKAFMRAQDGWKQSKIVYKTNSLCRDPKVAVDRYGNVHVVWVQRTGRGWEVYYRKKDTAGQWEDALNLTRGDVKIDEGPWPEIQVDVSQNPNIVYAAKGSGGIYDAWILRFLNNQWSPHTNVSNTPDAGTAYPNLVIDRYTNTYYVFWQNEIGSSFHIMTGYLEYGGDGSWTYGGVLSDANHKAYAPQADIDKTGKVYLVYINRLGTRSVIFTENQTPEDRLKWENYKDISGDTDMDFPYPEIAVDLNGNTYVVWMDGTQGNIEIYFTQKKIGGRWQTPINLSQSNKNSENPVIAVDKFTGDAYVAWEEGREIILRVYSNEDGKWGNPVVMTTTHHHSEEDPDAPIWQDLGLYASVQGDVHLVYSDDRTGYSNIYHTWKQFREPIPPFEPITTRLKTEWDTPTQSKWNTVYWKKNDLNEDPTQLQYYKVYRKLEGESDNRYVFLPPAVKKENREYTDRKCSVTEKYVYAVTVEDLGGVESKYSKPLKEEPIFKVESGGSLDVEKTSVRALFSEVKILALSWEDSPLNKAIPDQYRTYEIWRKKSSEPETAFSLIYTAGSSEYNQSTDTYFWEETQFFRVSDLYDYKIIVVDTRTNKKSEPTYSRGH